MPNLILLIAVSATLPKQCTASCATRLKVVRVGVQRLVEFELIKDLVRSHLVADGIACGTGSFKRLLERGMLLISWEELHLFMPISLAQKSGN